jgi:hypothetical protein
LALHRQNSQMTAELVDTLLKWTRCSGLLGLQSPAVSPWGYQEKANVPSGPSPPMCLPWKLQWVCNTVRFKLKTSVTTAEKPRKSRRRIGHKGIFIWHPCFGKSLSHSYLETCGWISKHFPLRLSLSIQPLSYLSFAHGGIFVGNSQKWNLELSFPPLFCSVLCLFLLCAKCKAGRGEWESHQGSFCCNPSNRQSWQKRFSARNGRPRQEGTASEDRIQRQHGDTTTGRGNPWGWQPARQHLERRRLIDRVGQSHRTWSPLQQICLKWCLSRKLRAAGREKSHKYHVITKLPTVFRKQL